MKSKFTEKKLAKIDSRDVSTPPSHLLVGPLSHAEQEEEEPDEANPHQEAERHHGDHQGPRAGAAPQRHGQQLVGRQRGQLVQVSVLSQPAVEEGGEEGLGWGGGSSRHWTMCSADAHDTPNLCLSSRWPHLYTKGVRPSVTDTRFPNTW